MVDPHANDSTPDRGAPSVPEANLVHGGYATHVLLSPRERIEAAVLLHDVYVREQGWIPEADNPSGLKIIRTENDSLALVDDFLDTAHWLGLFHDGTMCGCFRILVAPQDELSRYRQLPDMLRGEGVVELNRLAVAAEHRSHKSATFLLLRAALDIVLAQGRTVYCAAVSPDPAELYKKLGFCPVGEPLFKYNENEPNFVELLWWELRTHGAVGRGLWRVSERLLKGAADEPPPASAPPDATA